MAVRKVHLFLWWQWEHHISFASHDDFTALAAVSTQHHLLWQRWIDHTTSSANCKAIITPSPKSSEHYISSTSSEIITFQQWGHHISSSWHQWGHHISSSSSEDTTFPRAGVRQSELFLCMLWGHHLLMVTVRAPPLLWEEWALHA